MTSRTLTTTVLAAIIGWNGFAAADVVGPDWPPPGGATFATEGLLTRTGGQTFTLTEFDLCQSEAMFWGPRPDWVKIAFEGDTNGDGDPFEGDEFLTFAPELSDLAGGVGVWTGSTTARVFWQGQFQSFQMPTRFTLTLTGTGGLVEAPPLGLNGVGAVAVVTGDFQAHFIMETLWMGEWLPVLDWFDSMNQDPDPLYGECLTEFWGGFYWEVLSTDCNVNGRHDGCDIDEGTSADVNGNMVPDECECFGDTNGDMLVDVVDLVAVILSWGTCGEPCPADLNGDLVVDVTDLIEVVLHWGTC